MTYDQISQYPELKYLLPRFLLSSGLNIWIAKKWKYTLRLTEGAHGNPVAYAALSLVMSTGSVLIRYAPSTL